MWSWLYNIRTPANQRSAGRRGWGFPHCAGRCQSWCCIRVRSRDAGLSEFYICSIGFFSVFFYEAVVQHVTYVTGFCRIGKSCIPFMGNDPPQFSSTGVVAAQQPVKKLGKTGRSLIFVWWFLVRLLFFTACPRVVTLTALQTAGAFVDALDYRAVCTVQAAQPLYFVTASWSVVGTGGLCATFEWIPAAM